MPSVTTWQRLEPRTRSTTLRSVQARIHDPMWLLARQWQLGEFRGEDTGSLVRAEFTVHRSPLTRYRPDPPDAGVGAFPFPADAPLEAVVEAETGGGPATTGALFAAQAGQCFVRSLGPVLGARYRAAYVERYGLPSLPDAEADDLDDAGRRLLRLLVGRVPDGRQLRADLLEALRPASGTGALPVEPAIDAGDVDAVRRAAERFLIWFDGIAPPTRPEAWVPARFEHAFAVGAAHPRHADTDVALVAEEYAGGSLDWHGFDENSRDDLGAGGATDSESVTALPTAVRFPGMPKPRWWEFEEGPTNLGALDAAPGDLGRLALLQYALLYGNDFLQIPIEIPVGSLAWIEGLTVTTTFGETLGIPSVEDFDGAAGPFSMFRLTRRADGAGIGGRADFLLVAPTIGPSLHGPVLEQVLLMRDEMANLAWAVEERVQTPAGTSVVPREAAADRRRREAAELPEPALPPAPGLVYRLATEVPDHWLPLVPVLASRAVAGVSWDNVALEVAGLAAPRASLLASRGEGPLRIPEEEVPRTGAIVERTWQRARWLDGRVHVWVQRRKRLGRGEGSSGLRFDVLESG